MQQNHFIFLHSNNLYLKLENKQTQINNSNKLQ
jgi:hypothetical protein